VKLETGEDLDANGVLEDPEVTQTQYVCNRVAMFVALAAGHDHTCGLLASGRVKCWGGNSQSQSGIRELTEDGRLVAGIADVAQVVCGFQHTCAVKTDGSAWCWGYNGNGQLGDGTTVNKAMPVSVSGLGSGVSQMAAGNSHTCAMKTDGSAWCWGNNGVGQLGDGTTVNKITPTAVSGLGSGVSQMNAGKNHNCVVKMDGSAWCWGWNVNGQIGDGTATTPKTTPTAVSGFGSDVSHLVAGINHTCAVKMDGSAWCWGLNNYGQLGDGTTTQRLTPIAVSGLNSGVSQMLAGYDHTCAVKTDGSARCWGYNGYGQIGDGTTTTPKTTPTAVSGLGSGVSLMVAGYYHTCAIKTDGSAWCWGFNNSGQLGDGTTINRSTPTAVLFEGDLAP